MNLTLIDLPGLTKIAVGESIVSDSVVLDGSLDKALRLCWCDTCSGMGRAGT